MACGTPVIAFPRGSMPEIIEDGVNGLLVQDIDEAVSAVKKVKELDRRRCRQTVEERFTAEKMVDNYLSVYRRVLELSRKGSAISSGKTSGGVKDNPEARKRQELQR